MDAEQPSPPRLSIEQVEGFLVDHLGSEVIDVTAVEGGSWSSAFAFRQGGTDYIARFSRLLEDFAKDRIAAAYAWQPQARGLPVPRVIEVGEAFEGYFAISERARGVYLEELDETGMRAVLPGLLAGLDAARTVDLGGTRGYGVWGADGNAPHATWRAALLAAGEDRPGSRTAGWRAKLERSPAAAATFDEAYEHLRDLVHRVPEARHLVHSDLLYRNVLVEGARVTAIFDWGSSLYGDFLYDLAWLCFWSVWYPAWGSIDVADEARRHYASIGLEVPRFDERLRCYQVHIGLDGLAYQAFVERWEDLERTAERTLEVARGG